MTSDNVAPESGPHAKTTRAASPKCDPVLDPNIVAITLPESENTEQTTPLNNANTQNIPSKKFWQHRWQPSMAITQQRPYHFDLDVCQDHAGFVAESVREYPVKSPLEEKRETKTPVELDDQLAEAVPQFTLRNIAKIERYHDLQAPMPFDVDEDKLKEAITALAQARQTKIEAVEFREITNLEILEDYRTFLHEIIYLCPWDQIPLGPIEEDNPWHLKYSYAKLAIELQQNKDRIFVYGHEGKGTEGSFEQYGFTKH